MTPAEHYAEAEKLLTVANTAIEAGHSYYSVDVLIKAAGVHAQLAAIPDDPALHQHDTDG